MAEKTNDVLIVGSFIITGASAEAIEAVSAFFTWDKQVLIEDLITMYDPDDDEEFAIELTPENYENRPFIGVSVVIDPKDIINLDDIDPYEWTPVEEFIKLCNRDNKYCYKDVLFTNRESKPSGEVTFSIRQYALGFFGYDDDDVDERAYYPCIEATSNSNFKPTYCKLIRY